MVRNRLLFSFVTLALMGCDDDLPEVNEGGVIRGTITYDGTAHTSTTVVKAGIEVAAFITFPPSGPPHGSVEWEVAQQPSMSSGVPYEIKGVPAGKYFIVAQLVDLTQSSPRTGISVGGYPNMCSLQGTKVEVFDDRPTPEINIGIFDQGGLRDTCYNPPPQDAGVTDGGEEPGPLLRFTVTSTTIIPSGSDTISVMLFTSFPPMGPPSGFQSASTLAFPAVFEFVQVFPGDYAISGCYDKGGDHQRCDGPGDVIRYYLNGQKVSLVEGETAEVEMSLD